MIAGSAEQPVRIVSAMVGASLQNDGAPEVPSGRNLAASDAALVNGVAAHVLDYDDVAIAGHPSAVLVPPFWPKAGRSAPPVRMRSRPMSRATSLGAAFGPRTRPFARAWLSSDRGDGSACHRRCLRRVRKLDRTRTAHAIAIAASLGSGLVANFGSMTRSLHAGRTAQSGVLAARLADQGFTASLDALEHQSRFPARWFRRRGRRISTMERWTSAELAAGQPLAST